MIILRQAAVFVRECFAGLIQETDEDYLKLLIYIFLCLCYNIIDTITKKEN